MIITTGVEVLRGGKPGDRHWIETHTDQDPLDPMTACGIRATGMVQDLTDEPRRLTCLACREALVLHVMVTRD